MVTGGSPVFWDWFAAAGAEQVWCSSQPLQCGGVVLFRRGEGGWETFNFSTFSFKRSKGEGGGEALSFRGF